MNRFPILDPLLRRMFRHQSCADPPRDRTSDHYSSEPLDGQGGVYAFGTNEAAGTGEVASPDAVLLIENIQTFRSSLVSGICEVPICLAEGLGPCEQWVGCYCWACGVAESALDAVRELKKIIQLTLALFIF